MSILKYLIAGGVGFGVAKLIGGSKKTQSEPSSSSSNKSTTVYEIFSFRLFVAFNNIRFANAPLNTPISKNLKFSGISFTNKYQFQENAISPKPGVRLC